jgi:phosphoribosylanthranilate isomerase
MTWVKICGITSLEALDAAVEAGADALGFVFEPDTPRYVGDKLDAVRAWLRSMPEQIERVAVVGDAKNLPPDLKGFTAVQWVVGAPPPSALRRIKAYNPSRSEPPPSRADAHMVLLDAFRPGAWGGTGEAVDWEEAAAFVRSSVLPVILAGGLTPANVTAAVRQVQPFGVDVSSGVESSPGVKSASLIREFIQAVRKAS